MVIHAASISRRGNCPESRDERVFSRPCFAEPPGWLLRGDRLLPLLGLRWSLPREDPQKWPRLNLAQKHSAKHVCIYSSSMRYGS